MEYKGYTVAVSIALLGSGAQSHPTYTVLRSGEVVHESVGYAKFTAEVAAREAAHRAAREWIDAN
jgi:hypothetical protein